MRTLFSPILAVALLVLVAAPPLGAAPTRAPRPAQALLEAGNKKHEARDYDGAIADYTAAIALAPREAALYFNRGIARRDTGRDVEGALADFTKTLELNPKNPAACHFRGFLRFNQGDVDGALADYDRSIELDPKNAVVYLNRGHARYARGDLKGTLADFDQALALDPKFTRAYYNRGTTRAATGDLEGALADYEKALELSPEFVMAYYGRGVVRRDQGDLERARGDFDRAVDLNPKFVNGFVARGFIHGMQGNWMKASADFEAAGRAADHELAVALYRCVAQMRLGQSEEAKKELGAALDGRRGGHPGDWPAKAAEFLLGRIDEAALLTAAEAPGEQPARERKCDAWYFAGEARLAAGDQAAAAHCFRQSVATELPGLFEYASALSELKRLK
jgi:tetratricopeptide (TPR) repeat protein